MTSGDDSVLAKKIRKAKAGAAAPSDLGAFAGKLAKIVETKVSDLLGAEAKAGVSSRAGELNAVIAGGADPGVYYWLEDSSGEPALLVSVTPGFAAVMTARFLGDELVAASDSGAASAVDFEMAAGLVDVVVEPLSALIGKASKNAPRLAPAARRGMRTLKEVLRERAKLQVFALVFDLDFEGKPAPQALTLIFTASFLERAGLIETGDRMGPAPNPNWAEMLKRNVLGTEIALCAVLDRLPTTVGALSRLQVGQIIDLDANALTRLDITAATVSGPASVARGRLGSLNAHKAVKLTTDVDRAFLEGL